MPPVTVANPSPGMTTAATGKTGAVLPFTSASWDHEEPFYDSTFANATLGSAQNIGPIAVAAFGWMKGIWLRVTASGGSSSGAITGLVSPSSNTYGASDSPWNALSQIMLTNPNGQPYFGPYSGFNAAVVRRFGAYWGEYDNPLGGQFSSIQTASGAGIGNFEYYLYIPSQLVDRNGIGSLANENAKATYQLMMQLNAITTVGNGPGNTYQNFAGFAMGGLTVRLRAYLEAWAAPPPQDILGNMTSQVPPGNGTIQFWTTNGANPTAVGNYNVVFTRKGQYVRNWIFIVRNSAGYRDGSCLTDPIQLRKDGYILTQLTQNRWEEKMTSWYGLGQMGLNSGLANSNPNVSTSAQAGTTNTGFQVLTDTKPSHYTTATAATSCGDSQWQGVYAYPFTADLTPVPGAELRGRYFPTLQATRLEFVDTFQASALTNGGTGAPTLEIMTNDVAIPGDIFSRVQL